MSRAHALELVLNPPDDAAVRATWRGLEAAGVPSLARHEGATHRPHVTVATSPTAPDERTLARADQLWAPLLPMALDVAGLALLGRRRLTLAALLSVPDVARAAQLELALGWVDGQQGPWLPHLSLAARLPLPTAGEAVTLLHAARSSVPALPRCVVAAGLRWWNPEVGDVAPVAGAVA